LQRRSALCFFLEHLHRHGDEPLELLVCRLRQERLGPRVVFALGVAIEQAAQESNKCDALELRLALSDGDVLLAVEQRLETVRVAQRLGGE